MNHYSYYLLELIEKNNYKRFVEIGVWQCGTMKRILRYNKSLDEYWGVDNFDHIESGYHRKLSPEVWDGAYFQACRYMIYFPSLKILRMKSNEACKLFKNGSLDMVFIDGSHDYDSVIEDIKCWEPLIRKGGIISGHDYRGIAWDVNKAVNDVYEEEKINELPGSVWYVEL